MFFVIPAIVGLAVFGAVTPARSADQRHPELEALTQGWARISDFQATISAREVDGNTIERRSFHYSFLRPNHVKVEMLDGPARGMVVVWNGGDRVAAHVRGFLSPLLRRSFTLHDKTVTSLRGNTLDTPDLSPTLRCFAAKAENVREVDGPAIAGEATTIVVLEDRDGLRCPGDTPRDLAAITKDAIYLSRTTHLPVRRVRYAGDVPVEEWDLDALRVNTGLTLKDFD